MPPRVDQHLQATLLAPSRVRCLLPLHSSHTPLALETRPTTSGAVDPVSGVISPLHEGCFLYLDPDHILLVVNGRPLAQAPLPRLMSQVLAQERRKAQETGSSPRSCPVPLLYHVQPLYLNTKFEKRGGGGGISNSGRNSALSLQIFLSHRSKTVCTTLGPYPEADARE